MIAALLLALVQDGAEADYYAVDYLTPPAGEVLEIGGMDFLPDGRLVVSTRRGEVWMVENPLADDPADARFTKFAEGLWEGLGLKIMDGEIYVVQRGELSRLRDVDGDGLCDAIDTICDDWGLSENYHEFAYGLPVDADGNFYVSLNLAFLSPKWWHGKSVEPWRGWVVRISPDGELTPWACGFRSPCGIDLNAAGDLFVTDNQGDWMAASPIFHVKRDRFYGHPASLDWTPEYVGAQAKTSDTVPPARAADREPAAVWLPYKWSRSPGNFVPDTGGAFFEDQLFLAELTNGMILRVMLEKVRGEYQGAVIPFRQKIGSAVRVLFAKDGTLLTGFTNRGWGGHPPASGIGRIRATEKAPLEIENVHLLQNGFQIDFTKPLAEGGSAPGPRDVHLTQYDYDYWWEYGSPERATTEVEVKGLVFSRGRRRLTLHTAGLTPGMMARVKLDGVVAADGSPLLHDELAYTINQLPEGPATTDHVAKIVPPPPARESGEEGWLRLTYGDATDLWEFEGWELCDAELDPEDPTKLKTTEGVNALTNTASESPTDYVSKPVFGDVKIHVEFMLPVGGRSAVYIAGEHGVLLADDENACGSLLGVGGEPRAPTLRAYKGPGIWHELDVEFAGATFRRVLIDDVLVHENVALGEPVSASPLRIAGTTGPVAIGNVRVKPLREMPDELDEEGWTPIFDGESLEGWKISDDGDWEVEDDVIVGSGARSHLFSPRGDYTDFELRAKIKISDGGNSGLYFRTTHAPGWPPGYEAQVNSSYADPQRTGSLYGLAPVEAHLIAPDTWFDYHVTCRDESAGTHIVIRVNGVVITDFVDAERRHTSGHVALQQHHEGSVVEVAELWIREM